MWKKIDELLHAHAGRARGTSTKSMSSPLAGKLFDEAGRPLTPSHAVKGARRYRYYVSRSLITGTAEQTERGWRIPAAEFERRVAAATRTILKDRPGIAAEVEHLDWNAVSVKSIFEAANAWSERITSEAGSSRVVATSRRSRRTGRTWNQAFPRAACCARRSSPQTDPV